MNLLEISNEWKQKADELLAEKGLIETLSKFGTVHFTGAYSYNLMMHGDIDVAVVRDGGYSVEEVFDIFKSVYFQGKFRSYFIGGDWDDPRKGNEFPKGYYVGLKEKLGGERWKFDIWFLSTEEFAKRESNENLQTMTDEQRALILQCKEYRNEKKVGTTGQQIYDLVLSGEIKSLEDFKSNLEK
jgi:hypothetical protein